MKIWYGLGPKGVQSPLLIALSYSVIPVDAQINSVLDKILKFSWQIVYPREYIYRGDNTEFLSTRLRIAIIPNTIKTDLIPIVFVHGDFEVLTIK